MRKMTLLAALLAYLLMPPLPAGAQYEKPSDVSVLPLFFVARNMPEPTAEEKERLMAHLRWAQARYREMLQNWSTFQIADSPHVYRGEYDYSYYEGQVGNGAPACISELLEKYRHTRFFCPFIFLVVFMSPGKDFPTGGGRPLKGGINTGGGVVILSSYSFDRAPSFQTTMQHELGHSFGLTHVDVYGYDMNTNPSIMSYSPSQHICFFQPSRTTGTFNPEDLRALAVNRAVFKDLVFDPARDIPPGYALKPNLVCLGPMTIPGQVAYTLPILVTTESGETYGSSVRNVFPL